MIFFIVLIAESRLGFGLADILFQESRYEGDACIKHDLSLCCGLQGQSYFSFSD